MVWVGFGGGGQAELRADVRRPCGNMPAPIHLLLFCSSSRVVSDAACMSVKHATSSRLDYRLPRMGPSHETGHGGGVGGCRGPCAPARRAHARKVRVCFISASIVSAISPYRAGPGRDSHVMHNTQALCIHILLHAPRPPLSLTGRAILLVISPSYQFIRGHGSVDHSLDIRLTLPQQGQLELTHGSPSAAPVPIVRDRGRGKPSPGATHLKS